MTTQCEHVLGFMERNPEGITTDQARREFSVNRLAARIKDLRDGGHTIRTMTVKGRNKFNVPFKCARYVLVVPAQGDLFIDSVNQ